MSNVEASIERIRAFARSQNWSSFRLATEAKLSPQTTIKMTRPGWSPNVRTLRKLEALIPPDFDSVWNWSDVGLARRTRKAKSQQTETINSNFMDRPEISLRKKAAVR